MNTPNTNMMYPKFEFTSPKPLINTNDLSFLTPQPQRVLSNPIYPSNQSFTSAQINSEQKLNYYDNSLMFLGDDEFKNFNVNRR